MLLVETCWNLWGPRGIHSGRDERKHGQNWNRRMVWERLYYLVPSRSTCLLLNFLSSDPRFSKESRPEGYNQSNDHFPFFRIEQLKALLEESTTSESDAGDSSEDSSSSEEEKKKRNKKSKIKHKKKSKKKHKHKRYKSSKDSERDKDSIKRHSREKREERWFPFKGITMNVVKNYGKDGKKEHGEKTLPSTQLLTASRIGSSLFAIT